MKRSFLLKGIVTILIVFIFGLTAVGCEYINGFIGKGDEPDSGDIGDNLPDDGTGDDGEIEPIAVDKSALNTELALEVTEQGDYTESSYNAYLEKLAAAKSVLADEAATQDSVDKAAADLTAAREGLKVRSISAVENTNKEFKLIPGDVREIALADYINDNGLSKVTYEIKSSHDAVLVGEILDGKFTITAADVSDYVDAKLAIVVSYDGVAKLEIEFSVKITNDIAPVLKNAEFVKEVDLFDFANKESLLLDFAENVNNAGALELSYSVKCGDEVLVLDGATYTLALGEYGDNYTYVTYTVTVNYVANGNPGCLEYTYTLGLRDTGDYNVVNGSFENGLDGWTASESFGDITDTSTFWDQQFPMFNVGSYFSSEHSNKGSIASSYFTVKSKYATYMIGAAGKANVYITIEDAEGNVLALYRNTKFADLPAGVEDWNEQHQLIGVSVFVCNFVTYKVDLSVFQGMTVRFVIHDNEEGNGGFGFVLFDELNTYYASESDLPENATLADNLLANKVKLEAELALAVAEQGDYTLDSFNAYIAELAAAKALFDDIAATQAEVDSEVAALRSARLALTVRPIEAVEGSNKSFRITSGSTKEILIGDYINTNGVSSLTITLSADSDVLNIEPTDDGFSITANPVNEATDVKLTITVCYKDKVKLTVELSVQVTNDTVPALYSNEISKSYDVYTLENKDGLVIDLASNVDNAGNLPLNFTVNGVAADSIYTFNLGKYTDTVTNETLTVVVSYVANGESGSLEFTYTLAMTDTTAYRLVNGGFENGLEGWSVVGNIGGVSSDRTYWVEAIEFGMDGDKMFSAYAPGALESAVGTLTSSVFTVGGSNFVTFKLGAARDENYVYVDVVDAETKEILARYYNGLWTDADLSGCKLVAFKADLSAFAGREVFFRVSDNADSGYGLFFVDSFVTYYESEPDGFNAATPVSYAVSGTIYDVFNGGFEMGNVQGWWNNGEIGVVTNATGYWGDNIPYEKVGDYLFTGVESFGADTMREGNRGSLTSSAFELGGTGWISFKLGGGGNDLCYVQVIDAVTGEVLARYHQQAQRDAILIQYTADLSAYIGRTIRIQVVDQAENGWGCVSFDNLVTYHTTIPEGILAIDIKGDLKYTIDNGSFENGLEGWHQNIWDAGAHNTLGWVESSEHDAGWYTKNDDRKDGDFLFTFCRPDGTNCENTKGELVSSTFSLKQGSFVSFKFGGAGSREVRIELCRADGSVIARFYNEAPGKANTEMYSYYYQYNGPEVNCFFRVVDDSVSNYGCFVVDDFRVNLESAPEGYIAAIQ